MTRHLKRHLKLNQLFSGEIQKPGMAEVFKFKHFYQHQNGISNDI
jgi:hypothetical protein